MEIKNNQILLIESSLNELHKIISEKESKILQLQKDKNELRDTITSNKYEFESIYDEKEKLNKQIKILFEKQNDLKDELRDKDMNLTSMENSKRQTEKMIQSKNDTLINSMEEKLYEVNEENKHKQSMILELKKNNEYLNDIIELSNSDIDALKYDNNNLKKTIKRLKESIFQEEQKTKIDEYNKIREDKANFQNSNNLMLENLEKKLLESKKQLNGIDSDKIPNSLSEAEILKNNLGL
jgi:chromosome segregation ATPase